MSKRHLPRSQTEALPVANDDAETTDDESVKASSYRANFLPPGVDFGSLDAISSSNYDSFKAESLMSPVFSQLAMVRPEKLEEASEDAQKLRRKLMRGSSVLIVQGGYLGKRFIYDRLKELGCTVTIIDGPDSVWRNMADLGVIHEFIELDFTEHETLFARAMDAISEAAQGAKFDACCTYFEDAVCLSARIATALGLETNSIDACEKARNKGRTREVMSSAGLPVPKFYRITSADDLPAACATVGFPAILKPVFGAASIGVTRVESEEETISKYQEVLLLLDVDDDPIWAQGKEMVLEEFYDGDEFDLDLLLSNGKSVYCKVSDNWACYPGYFQESGTNCPSLYPEDKQEELINLAIDSTLALGFTNGCFHVEAKYTSRGPRLIEVNARMGGVSVRDVNMHAWGIDLVEEHMMTALRIPVRPLIPEKPLEYMAECAVNAPYSGIIHSEGWLDYVLKDKRVHKINYFKKKGEKVSGPEDSMPDWVVEILVISKKSQEEACGLIREIVHAATPPITPNAGSTEKPFFFPDHMHPF